MISNDFLTQSRRTYMLGLGSIVSVNSSITLMHPLSTEIMTIEICLAKFSNPF